jgi:WD40 repeat protein
MAMPADGTTFPPRSGTEQVKATLNEVAATDVQSTLAWFPPPGGVTPPAAVAVPGYQILGELGRGGMGVVYRARQIALKRVVALKMVLAGGHASVGELDRFRREAEAVARLQHPNIVQIYEVGEHDDLPYFSLEYCAGGSLAAKLHGTPLPAKPAAELVATLARAMHAAHQAGVVHRDLKPANVLLTDDGMPKVTDFGLAKTLDATGVTRTGAVMGTPSYMAPEQAAGEIHSIGPAADVYALGAILYELLTGRPPFKAATAIDTVMQVVADEPVSVRRLQPKTPRDLETVALRCLAKEPGKRYATAAALADDLDRFVRGEPIVARPVGRVQRTAKWARRRPALAALAVVSVAAAGGLVGGGIWYNAELSRERDAATRAKADAEADRDRAVRAEADALRQRAQADEQRDLARKQEAAATRAAYRAQFYLAQHSWEQGRVRHALETLQGMRPRSADETDYRSFEWFYLHGLCHTDLYTYRGHNGFCYDVAFSPDGRRVASVAVAARDVDKNVVEPARVKVWDPFTGRDLFACDEGHRADIAGVAFSPDGKWIASAGGGLSGGVLSLGEVKLWDAETGKLVRSFDGHLWTVVAVAFSPDGKRLASAGTDRVVRIWDVSSGAGVQQMKGHSDVVRRLAFSPDGTRLASASVDKTVKVWDVDAGKLIHDLRGHRDQVLGVAFHPDGRRLASGGTDKGVVIWDVDTGKEFRALTGSAGSIASVAFSPDGKQLAVGGGDPLIRVWDWNAGREIAQYRGRANGVNAVIFSRDQRLLAAAGSDGAVTVWETSADPRAPEKVAGSGCLAFGPDGKTTAFGRSGTVTLRTGSADQADLTFRAHGKNVNGVVFSPDGRLLATASDDKSVKVWRVNDGRELRTLNGHTGTVTAVVFGPGGRWLASASEDKTVRLWDVTSGRLLHTLDGGHNGAIAGLCRSPDGRLLVSSGLFLPEICIWDPGAGALVRKLSDHTKGVIGVAFSPDGSKLASGSLDGTLKVWDPATGRIMFEIRAGFGLGGVAFSPDGRLLAAGTGNLGTGEEARLLVWDAATGQQVLDLPGVGDIFWSVSFSPDGHRLAGASASASTCMIWTADRPTAPDTDRWPVIFADDFSGAELGPHWQPSTSWKLEDGHLCGPLQTVEYHKLQVDDAHIGLTLKLPQTVEVRFDCWSSADLNTYAMFSKDGANQSIQAWLSGVPQHFAVRGAAIIWQGGLTSLPVLATNPHLDVRPSTRYRVRILREPRRMTMFVNGVEVASAAVPLLEAQTLSLGGMMGKPGSEVFLANVEIRAPQDQAAK